MAHEQYNIDDSELVCRVCDELGLPDSACAAQVIAAIRSLTQRAGEVDRPPASSEH